MTHTDGINLPDDLKCVQTFSNLNENLFLCTFDFVFGATYNSLLCYNCISGPFDLHSLYVFYFILQFKRQNLILLIVFWDLLPIGFRCHSNAFQFDMCYIKYCVYNR